MSRGILKTINGISIKFVGKQYINFLLKKKRKKYKIGRYLEYCIRRIKVLLRSKLFRILQSHKSLLLEQVPKKYTRTY